MATLRYLLGEGSTYKSYRKKVNAFAVGNFTGQRRLLFILLKILCAVIPCKAAHLCCAVDYYIKGSFICRAYPLRRLTATALPKGEPKNAFRLGLPRGDGLGVLSLDNFK